MSRFTKFNPKSPGFVPHTSGLITLDLSKDTKVKTPPSVIAPCINSECEDAISDAYGDCADNDSDQLRRDAMPSSDEVRSAEPSVRSPEVIDPVRSTEPSAHSRVASNLCGALITQL